MRKDIRNNLRVMCDDVQLAAKWYERLRRSCRRLRLVWNVCGLNERFRYYRYEVGQYFAPHFDGCFRRSDVEESLFTFMIYLNDDFEGGETKFYFTMADCGPASSPNGVWLSSSGIRSCTKAPVREGP